MKKTDTIKVQESQFADIRNFLSYHQWQLIHPMLRSFVWHTNGINSIMETIDILHAELEELQKKYWKCFNNWDCNEDLEKIHGRIEELKHKLSFESA